MGFAVFAECPGALPGFVLCELLFLFLYHLPPQISERPISGGLLAVAICNRAATVAGWVRLHGRWLPFRLLHSQDRQQTVGPQSHSYRGLDRRGNLRAGCLATAFRA